MVVNITTASVLGLDVYKITTEVDIINALPGVSIVGLPDAAVSEARERIRSAIKNSSFDFPSKKIVINLAPADIKKEGSGFDLAMAVGILSANEVIEPSKTKDVAFIGELSLDGSLRGVNGVLPIVLSLQDMGVKSIVVPKANEKEASIATNMDVYALENLEEVVNLFKEDFLRPLKKSQGVEEVRKYLEKEANFNFDFKDVKGQQKAKRALEIAAAGSHNMLMVGTPGSGKTLLAKCFPSILPPLSIDEAIELTKIYSISGLVEKDKPLIDQRPFRAPHHSASAVGIIGGGGNPKPGEITLAHHGVLFLDEMVEFPRNVLEVLRQPLEDGIVSISRAQMSVKYPADFILLGAMNPCPCGFYGDTQKQCVCNDYQSTRYWARLSGPLLDRIDLQIEVPRLKEDELLNKVEPAESSSEIKQRVVKARNIQLKRFSQEKIFSNSQMMPKQIKKYCNLNEQGQSILKMAINKFDLSARAYDRLLKLSRTIADLDSSDEIQPNHIAEAIQYRNIERH